MSGPLSCAGLPTKPIRMSACSAPIGRTPWGRRRVASTLLGSASSRRPEPYKSAGDASQKNAAVVAAKRAELTASVQAHQTALERQERVLLFLDECFLLWGDLCGSTWGKRGERLTRPSGNPKQRQALYGAIDAPTGEMPMLPSPKAERAATTDCLTELLPRHPTATLTIGWDNASWQRGGEGPHF